MFPLASSKPANFQSEPFETLILDNFRGGLNITDPDIMLGDNVFTQFQDLQLTRTGIAEMRPPFRPECFSASIQDKPITDGSSAPDTLLDFQVLPCTVTDWNYNGRLYVAAGIFGTDLKVLAYKIGATNAWQVIATFASATAISICPFRLNAAFDLLLFPNNADAVRWPVGSASTTALGLTAPAAADFDSIALAEAAGGGISLTNGRTVHYKFSYVYDDSNSTTMYGESETATLTDTGIASSLAIAATNDNRKITITFNYDAATFPSTVSKIRIYRAPDNDSNGPYKYVGEVEIPSSDVDFSFIDTTPWNFEGDEDILAGSNPATSNVRIQDAVTIGSSVMGFDVNDPSKLIWSDPGQPDVWNPLNLDYLNSEGKRCVEFNRKIYVFTEKSVFEKAGTQETAYLICNVGTPSGRSVQNVGSGIVWMGDDSVYFADFVTQYGSKGDFPRDVGHAVSVDIEAYDNAQMVSSMFREQRYYLLFTSENAGPRLCYVFDIDQQSWASFTWNHLAVSGALKKHYTVGKTAAGVYYVYEHDYYATVSTASGSSYDGIDYHDYDSINAGAFAGMTDIPVALERSGIRLGGDYRRAILSSASLNISGSGAAAIILATDQAGHESSQTFSDSGSSDTTAYAAVYDFSTYAGGTGAATATDHGYAGDLTTKLHEHKKFPRPLKSFLFTIRVTFTAPRNSRILLLGLYYRLLPPAA